MALDVRKRRRGRGGQTKEPREAKGLAPGKRTLVQSGRGGPRSRTPVAAGRGGTQSRAPTAAGRGRPGEQAAGGETAAAGSKGGPSLFGRDLMDDAPSRPSRDQVYGPDEAAKESPGKVAGSEAHGPAAPLLDGDDLDKATRNNPIYQRRVGFDPDVFASGVDVDSPELAQAVADYQKQHGLHVDGMAGPKTCDHLDEQAGEGGGGAAVADGPGAGSSAGAEAESVSPGPGARVAAEMSPEGARGAGGAGGASSAPTRETEADADERADVDPAVIKEFVARALSAGEDVGEGLSLVLGELRAAGQEAAADAAAAGPRAFMRYLRRHAPDVAGLLAQEENRSADDTAQVVLEHINSFNEIPVWKPDDDESTDEPAAHFDTPYVLRRADDTVPANNNESQPAQDYVQRPEIQNLRAAQIKRGPYKGKRVRELGLAPFFGKATPMQMQVIAQACIDEGITTPAEVQSYVDTGNDCRGGDRYNGKFGVDCGGVAGQVSHLLEGEEGDGSDPVRGFTNRGASHYTVDRDTGRPDLSGFEPVAPEEARPGDMVSTGPHVMVVTGRRIVELPNLNDPADTVTATCLEIGEATPASSGNTAGVGNVRTDRRYYHVPDANKIRDKEPQNGYHHRFAKVWGDELPAWSYSDEGFEIPNQEGVTDDMFAVVRNPNREDGEGIV